MKKKKIIKIVKKVPSVSAEIVRPLQESLSLDAFPENGKKENTFRFLKGESYRALR